MNCAAECDETAGRPSPITAILAPSTPFGDAYARGVRWLITKLCAGADAAWRAGSDLRISAQHNGLVDDGPVILSIWRELDEHGALHWAVSICTEIEDRCCPVRAEEFAAWLACGWPDPEQVVVRADR